MATKKSGLGKKIFIAGAVLGGGYLLYNYLLKDLIKKPTTPGTPGGEFVPSADDQMKTVIDNANDNPANVVEIKSLHPLGTDDKKLYYDLVLKYGDKGAEINKLQRITNVIAKNYGTSSIGVDGSWGPQTEEKIKAVYGVNKLSLRTALKKMNRVQNWVNAGKKGKESDYPSTTPGAAVNPLEVMTSYAYLNPYQKF